MGCLDRTDLAGMWLVPVGRNSFSGMLCQELFNLDHTIGEHCRESQFTP